MDTGFDCYPGSGSRQIWVEKAGSEKKTIFGRTMTEVWDAGLSLKL